jgi:purine-nucleoside phosphorylase
MIAAFDRFSNAVRSAAPAVAIVLGSGTSVVADRVHALQSLPFADVPTLSAASVAGHRGRLTLGEWAGQYVLLFEGRLHYYEGHSWEAVLKPIQIAHDLGARVLLATNAAGGIHPALGPGSLMAIRDHILWNLPRPWLLPGPGALGSSRPSPYSPRLLDVLAQAGKACGIDLFRGIYASLTGPCYETPAEIRALRAWGADAVGMSTAREVEAAMQVGMECAAFSCITNKAAGLSDGPLDHKEVLVNAALQTETVAAVIEGFLRRWNE